MSWNNLAWYFESKRGNEGDQFRLHQILCEMRVSERTIRWLEVLRQEGSYISFCQETGWFIETEESCDYNSYSTFRKAFFAWARHTERMRDREKAK